MGISGGGGERSRRAGWQRRGGNSNGEASTRGFASQDEQGRSGQQVHGDLHDLRPDLNLRHPVQGQVAQAGGRGRGGGAAATRARSRISPSVETAAVQVAGGTSRTARWRYSVIVILTECDSSPFRRRAETVCRPGSGRPPGSKNTNGPGATTSAGPSGDVLHIPELRERGAISPDGVWCWARTWPV